jgi:hypothetical protein
MSAISGAGIGTDGAELASATPTTHFWRWTGAFALAVVAFSWAQFPLYAVGGAPSTYDGSATAQHLYSIRAVAFTRIVLDLGVYVAILIFAARFGQLVRQARRGYEWLAALLVGSAAVWLGVSLVADGLVGGATLDTLKGTADPSAVRALIEGTLVIYNGATAFVMTGLFVGSAGYATMATGVLPRWTGWLAFMATGLCLVSIPALYLGPVDPTGFYNPGGWGPAIIANFPPLIWFLVIGVVMARRRDRVATGV